MKKTTLLISLAASAVGHAAIVQTVSGPFVTSGGGVGTVLINTANDTDDWITDLSSGGTYFLGWDWTIDNNAGESGGGGFFGGLGIYNGTTERLLLGNTWFEQSYSGGAPGVQEDTTIAYAVGTTVRLVAELTVVDGGASNDTWKLWVNPTVADLASPDAQRTDWTIDDFTRLTNRAGNGSGQATTENLVVATDFASAVGVPEPGSVMLLALGGVALIFRRRK